MPLKPIKRRFYGSLIACGIGLAIAAAFEANGTQGGFIAFLSISLAFAFTCAYFIAKNRVWIVLSKEGIEGRGFFGLKNTVKWTATSGISLYSSRLASGGIQGFTLNALDRDGFAVGFFGSVFIPKAVFESEEFQSGLTEYAPINHGLRIHQSDGARRNPVSNKPVSHADPATESLLHAIEERRKADPLIGAKLGGKEIFQRLLNGMKGDRGVHIESLLCALGALAGYSCQASIRAQAVAKGLPEISAFFTVSGEDGRTYFFGDPLNQALAESQYSVWGLAGGVAQKNGCKKLPDINKIFAHVASSVGGSSFGIPRLPDGLVTSDTPINYLKALWPVLFPIAKVFSKEPIEWPLMFGAAIQEALDAGKDVLAQDVMLTIIMESAIPMSKVDLAAV